MRAKGYGGPTAAAIAIGLAALAAPSAASAQAVPDASCTSPSVGVIGQPGNNRGAQTFTAQHTGALTRAQVEIDKIGNPSDWNLSINSVDGSGTPTNTVLAATTVPDASVPDGVGTLTGDFASPATVTAGQQYALVFARPASDTLRIRYSVVNACSGFAFFSSSQAARSIRCAEAQMTVTWSSLFLSNLPPQARLPSPQRTRRRPHRRSARRRSTSGVPAPPRRRAARRRRSSAVPVGRRADSGHSFDALALRKTHEARELALVSTKSAQKRPELHSLTRPSAIETVRRLGIRPWTKGTA